MNATHNQICRAIDRLMAGYCVGLCSAFLSENYGEYDPCRLIEACGGKVNSASFYWYHLAPFSAGDRKKADQALNQRLMFLAFMLTPGVMNSLEKQNG